MSAIRIFKNALTATAINESQSRPRPQFKSLAYANGAFDEFPVYVDENRPAMGATNAGDGIRGGLQLFPEQYWQATIGGQVG